MSRYDFVLYGAQCDDFIERLRGIGLVDITTTGWEPSDADRQLLLDIEGCGKAFAFIERLRLDGRCDSHAKAFATGREAFNRFTAAYQSMTALHAERARLEKLADELRPWGRFSTENIARLAQSGVVLRYFTAPANTFDKMQAHWAEQHTLWEVSRYGAAVYFVAVTAPDEELSIEAQEVKAPAMDVADIERRIAATDEQLAALDGDFSRVAATEHKLEAYHVELRERLQDVRVKASAEDVADGTLMVMEGWAERSTSAEVDALLEKYPNVVYLKRDPTPDDNTPVKLKNNRFARVFELVGDLYARPKYGTIDLTPFFAPFYMLFFGICLNDAGYGAILALMGAAMLWKFKTPGMMRQAAWFATLCGLMTMVVGLFCGSFFGLNLGDYFPSVKFYDFQSKFFSMALVIGIVQIFFALLLNLWLRISTLGFKHSLGTLGWIIIMASALLAMGLPMLGVSIEGFGTGDVAFYIAMGAGAVLMLLLNDPGRNPIVNIGAGLWDLYNRITSLLSDVLSYIRLFAIGLSGGVLALVFNTLATGIVPDGVGIFTRILIMIPILLIGHGLNLFMSCISSFVHPLRLTFVEFFKNAGFEAADRTFEPLQKIKENSK